MHTADSPACVHREPLDFPERRQPIRSRTEEAAGGKYKRLSIEGRRVDALALGADERRDKLRKAAGSCT